MRRRKLQQFERTLEQSRIVKNDGHSFHQRSESVLNKIKGGVCQQIGFERNKGQFSPVLSRNRSLWNPIFLLTGSGNNTVDETPNSNGDAISGQGMPSRLIKCKTETLIDNSTIQNGEKKGTITAAPTCT